MTRARRSDLHLARERAAFFPRRALATGALLVFLWTSIGAAAAQSPATSQPIRPGYWETRLSAFLLGGRDRRCVHSDEVARFVGGPHNHVYACQYPTSIVGAGHVEWRGTCTSRRGQTLSLDASGSYTDTSIDMRGRVSIRLAGIPISAPFTVRARRLGDCSAFPAQPVVQRR